MSRGPISIFGPIFKVEARSEDPNIRLAEMTYSSSADPFPSSANILSTILRSRFCTLILHLFILKIGSNVAIGLLIRLSAGASRSIGVLFCPASTRLDFQGVDFYLRMNRRLRRSKMERFSLNFGDSIA